MKDKPGFGDWWHAFECLECGTLWQIRSTRHDSTWTVRCVECGWHGVDSMVTVDAIWEGYEHGYPGPNAPGYQTGPLRGREVTYRKFLDRILEMGVDWYRHELIALHAEIQAVLDAEQ